MPRLIRNDGISVQVRTQIFTNFIFERDSTVELQYYNTFKTTNDNAGFVTTNNEFTDYFSEYVESITTISVDLTYSTQGFKENVDVISFDTNPQTSIVENIWNSLKTLEQKTGDFKSLFETILKISDSIKSNNNSNEFLSTGLSRDIIQQYVLEYHKSENMVDGQILPSTRLQYIIDRVAEYGPEVLSKSRNYVIDINNKISYIDKLLVDSGEFILRGENSQFVKSNIDNLVRIASVSSSYGEFIDSVSNVFYEPNGNNSVKSNLNEYVHLFKDYIARDTTVTNILGEWKTEGNSLILKPSEYIDNEPTELIAVDGVVIYTENKVHKNLSDSIYTKLNDINDISSFYRDVLISDKNKVLKDLNTNYDFHGGNTLILTQALKTNRLLGKKIITGATHKVLDYTEELEIFPTRTNLEFGNLNLIQENSFYSRDTQSGNNYETSDNINTISGRNRTFIKEPYLKIEIGSSGLNDSNFSDVTQNITVGGVLNTFNTPRSYRMTRLKKVNSKWSIIDSNSYDVYGDVNQASLALQYLQEFDNGDMLVLTTWDEPQNNKNIFENELINSFGSTLQYSPDWSFRCSYQLVSIKGQAPILEEIKPVGSATGIENTITWSESFGFPQSNMITPYGDTEFLNITENNNGYMVLGDVYRSTASLPFLYTKSEDSLENSPDYIHFLYNTSELLEIRDNSNNIVSNRLVVKLYSWSNSNNDINLALSTVDTNFYSKSSHNLLQTYYIDYSSDVDWKEYSINLVELFDSEPIGHQQILWLEFEREPTLPYNPFEGGVDSQQIFDTWTRISHNSSGTYPASASETNAWQLSSGGDIQCTINSGTYIGFVSPEPVGGYVLDTVMTSSNADNDMVSLVLGYFEENGVQHTLNFARIRAGMFFSSTWAIGTNFGQSYGFGGGDTGFTPTGALNFLNTGTIPGETGGGWSGLETRVRVSKDPVTNIITVEATPFGTTGDADFVTVATVDLNSNTYLQKFITSNFGFSAWSQNASSWTNISFEQTYVFAPEDAKYGNIGIGGVSLQNNFVNPETYTNNVYKIIQFPDKVEDIYESYPPTYLSKPNDILNTNDLYLQKPDDTVKFKNLFVKVPSDKSLLDKSYIGQPSDKIISKKLYIGPPKDKVVHINNFFEKISKTQEPKGNYFSEEYSFVYSTKFADPKLKDYVYNMNPYYGEDADKTYLNKLFYVDLDDFTVPYGMIPYLYKPGDTFFIPDTHYVKTKNDNNQSLNIFEKKMDLYELHGGRVLNSILIFYDRNSSQYGGMYYDYDTAPEFVYSGEFVGVSFYSTTKEWIIPHIKIQSGHPRSGGSEAYGHDVIGLSRVEPNHKVLPFFGLVKESDVMPAGRHGRSIDQEYRVTQNVQGRNNPTGLLYEFEEVYHDLDLDSGGIGEGKYNFNYEVIEGSGRIPDCLKLDQQKYVLGQIKESDAFIKKYYFESWIKDQGHFGTLDENYDDFKMIDPRVFKTGILGIASTRGTIDIIIDYPELNGFRYEIGDTIRQNLSTATITDILDEYKTPIDLGDGFGEIERTVIQYELQNINGEFEELSKTVQYVFETKSSREELGIRIANLQLELSNTDPASSRYAELVELISSLNNELNIVGDYTFLVVTGTSVSYDITQVENQRGLNLKVYRTEINTARGLRKFVDLIFTVYNNWSYDRDKFLYSSDRLPDKLYYKGEYLDRDVWVDRMRSDGFFRFDNEENNLVVTELINSFKSDYESGALNFSENEYNEQLEIYNAMLSLGNTPNEVEYLENIEPFTLNCEISLTEKEFYELSTDTRIVRGYPVYASCN